MKDFVCTSWFHDDICIQGLYLDSVESLESDYSYKILTETDEKGNLVEILEMYFADGVHEGHYGTFQLLEYKNDTLIMKNLRNNVDLRYFRKK